MPDRQSTLNMVEKLLALTRAGYDLALVEQTESSEDEVSFRLTLYKNRA